MKEILFLCVTSSARSQMAEAIARSMTPAGTKVWSVGSRPTSLRSEGVAELAEIGLDASGHGAKPVPEIPADKVDTIITLCAEEGCPIFLGMAVRRRRSLPDLADLRGSEEERLIAFRDDQRTGST